ncbi:MAG: hypothetical protein RBQ66_08325 [Candidatus Cloacimonadaceae bacterium]|nr:hypothetical protein [Candidatus Cloacimonadota bacterium]MDY0299812.1 hypothetical protein [Candidatus Cloacimonadaceae bacterium]
MIVECYRFHPDNIPSKIPKGFLVELRLDFYPNIEATDYKPLNKRFILTCRGKSLTREVLDKMLASTAYIDLDLNQAHEFLDLVEPKRLILSLHLIDYDEDQIWQFLQNPIQAAYYKFIFKAKSLEEILSASELIKKSGKSNVIFNVSGKWALFQRSLYHLFNSQACYCAYDEPLYDGQPQTHELMPIHHAVFSLDHSVLLIIGSGKVNQSGSIVHGNPFLSSAGIPTAYIPVPAKNVDEAVMAVKFVLKNLSLLGLAITNPYKSSLAKYFNTGRQCINTIRFCHSKKPQSYYHAELDRYIKPLNTDIKALRDALQKLNINLQSSILIYGSGSCANIFIKYLQLWKYERIHLLSRNLEQADKLRRAYNLEDKLKQEYCLLINASPLGQNPSDDLSVLPKYNALINLALPQPLSLLEDDAKTKEIPTFTSTQFWVSQFSTQLSFLIKPETN